MGGGGECKQNLDSKYYERSCRRHALAHRTNLAYYILTTHQISWFAVNSASFKFFTGKDLTSILIPYPSHAVLRWFSDFTTLKVAHNLIDNSAQMFPKGKKKATSQINFPNGSIFLSWVLHLTTGTGSLKKNLFSNHNVWETKHTPET